MKKNELIMKNLHNRPFLPIRTNYYIWWKYLINTVIEK